MPEFDIVYQFTVTGVRTVEGDTPEAAVTEHAQDITDGISDELGPGAMLDNLSSAVYEHDEDMLENDIASIQQRIADGHETLTHSYPKSR